MFNLIYRDGAPENTGHYEVFDKATGSDKGLKVGTLVNVANGVASAYSSGKPYGVVAINAADNEDAVAVLKITEDMIFKTTCDFGDPTLHSNHSIGEVLTVEKETITNTIAESGYGFEIIEVDNVGIVEGASSHRDIKGRFVNLGA